MSMFDTCDYGQDLPPKLQEKLREYQQVAALLCLDIDLLVDVCEAKNLTADELLRQIHDLQDKKDQLLRSNATREQRYSAAAALFSRPW